MAELLEELRTRGVDLMEYDDRGRDSMEGLRDALRSFAHEREWDQFHSSKNLVCALSVEVGELMEHFIWDADLNPVTLTPERREQIQQEIGDVLLYLVRLADKLGVDPINAAQRKLALNAERYPVHLAKGSSKKYTEL